MDHKAYSPRRELAALLSSAGVVAALTVAPTFAIAEEAPAVTGENSEIPALVETNETEDDQGLVSDEASSSTGTGASVMSEDIFPAESPSISGESDSGGDEGSTDEVDDTSSTSPSDETNTSDKSQETDDVSTSSAGDESVVENSSKGETEVPEKTAENGTYVIESASSDKQVVDTAGSSKSDCANVQSNESKMSGTQKWALVYDEKTGYYSVAISGTDQVLDVACGSAKDGANVQIYKSNGTDAQRWRIQENVLADGNKTYTFFSKLGSNFVLTMDSSSISSGTNICLRAYVASNKSQQFYLLTTNPDVAVSDYVLPHGEGAYTVTPSGDSGYAITVSSGSKADGANVQINKASSSSSQKLYFQSDGAGYYTIYVEGSGKVLDVASGNLVSGTNVQQYKSNGTDAQKWALRKNSDGTCSIISKANGLLLDISCGKVVDGANIQVYRSNGTAAQKFVLSWLSSKVTGYNEFIGDAGTSYVIESGTNDIQVVDVSGGSTSNCANIQTYQSNMTGAQRWVLTKGSDGYYTISLSGKKNMVLDIASGSLADGANVQLYESNGTLAQKWKVYKVGDYNQVIIVSALRNDLVLDLASGGTSNYTNVQTFTANGTKAQKFYLIDANVSVAPTSSEVQAAFKEGAYVVTSSESGKYALDVVSGSTDNYANVQLYSKNGTSAQRLYFKLGNDGFYTITVIGSGKVIEVDGGNIVPGTNVQQYTNNGTDAQKWALRKNSDGTYSFVNKANGLLLDISCGKIADGSNIQVYRANTSDAQNFNLTKTNILTDGIYQISSLKDLNQVVDVKEGSSSSGATLQIYESNGTLAQRYQVVYDSSAGTYRIRTAASGGWVTVNSKEKAVQSGSSATKASSSNTWKVIWNGNYFSLANVGTGKVLDLTSGSTANGSVLQTYDANATSAQHFLFKTAQLISDGMYEIHSGINNNLNVNVANGSSAVGANVELWTDNGENAQKFYVTLSGTGYVIKNVSSGLVLDVENGSKADAANVRQWSANGSSAQLWNAQIADGGYVVFVNANSGKALDVSCGTNSAGANIDQYAVNGTAAQKWKLEPTHMYGWVYENGGWNFYYADGSKQSFAESTKIAWDRWMASNTYNSGTYAYDYMVTVDQARFYTNILKKNSSGSWEPLYGWLCAVGKDNATPNGYFEITGRHDYTEGSDEYTRQYYYTEFNYWKADELGQCFHSLCYSYGNLVQDGRGTKISSGCVRLLTEQAKWIYDTLPTGTFVWIYEY